MTKKTLKILSVLILVTILSLTACITKPNKPTPVVSEKVFDGVKAVLNNSQLNLYTLNKGIKTYVLQIEGMVQTSSKANQVTEDRLVFFTKTENNINLYASSREEAFKANQLIGTLNTDLKTLDNLKIAVKKIENIQLSTSVQDRDTTEEGTLSTILGDYNRDYLVDLKDFDEFVNQFGKESADHKLSPAQDTNGDGLYDTKGESVNNIINEDDFTVFAHNFGYGEILSLVEIGEYSLAEDISFKIARLQPDYHPSYLVMLLGLWNGDGGQFISDQYKYLDYFLQEMDQLDWYRCDDLYNFLNNNLDFLDHLYYIGTNLEQYWPEDEAIEIKFPYMDKKLVFDRLSAKWFFSNMSIFRTYANLITAYDLHADYPYLMDQFTWDDENNRPKLDRDGDGFISPDEFNEPFPENFGKLYENRDTKMEKVQDTLRGLSGSILTDTASAVLSNPEFFDATPTTYTFVNYELDRRFGEDKTVVKQTLELVWNMRKIFQDYLPGITDGNDTSIQLDDIFGYFMVAPETSQRSDAAVTVNFSSFFDSQLNNLKELFIPTMQYNLATQEEYTFVDSATMAFFEETFGGLLPNGAVAINEVFEYLSNPTNTMDLYHDQSIWIDPTEPDDGTTIKVYGVDGNPVSNFTLIIPDFGIYQGFEGAEAHFNELPQGTHPVVIWGVSQNAGVIGSKRFTKEFMRQKNVNFNLEENGQRGKVIEIHARNAEKNIQFDIKDKNGNPINTSEKTSIILCTKSNLLANYNIHLEQGVLIYPFTDFYPATEWVKMDVDEITLIDAQMQTSGFQIYNENVFSTVPTDTTIPLDLAVNGTLRVDTIGMGDKIHEKINIMRTQGWFAGGKLGFEFSDYQEFPITANRNYRALYYLLKQNTENEYYHYGLRFGNGETARLPNFYLEENEVLDLKFTEENWDLKTHEVIQKENYKLGEQIAGSIFIKDGFNNTVFFIEKYTELTQLNSSHRFTPSDSTQLSENTSREENWITNYNYEYTINPVVEIQDSQGLTIFKSTEGTFINWRIPTNLKPGEYKVLFRWDTGPIAGVLQKTKTINIVESEPDFHVLPELWDDVNGNGVKDAALIFRVNMYDDQKWNAYDEVYVTGPNLDDDDPEFIEGKGFWLNKEDWGDVKGFRSFMWSWDKWPTIGQVYTVNFYKDGEIQKSITDAIDFLFPSLPKITAPQNQQNFPQPQNVDITWEKMAGAQRYEVWVDRVRDADWSYRVHNVRTENNSAVIPKEVFENDAMYKITVMAYKTTGNEIGDSRSAKSIQITFGNVDKFTLELRRELWNIDMNKGFSINLNFFDQQLAEKVNHIWVSGPGIEGGRFDLVEHDWDGSFARYSTFYGLADDKMLTGDTYRVTVEYNDGTADVRDVLIYNTDRTYPDVISPTVNQKFTNEEDIVIEWNDTYQDSSNRAIKEKWFQITAWKIDNGYHGIYGQRIDVNQSGQYFHVIPQEYLEEDYPYNITVQKYVRYEESQYYTKEVVSSVQVTVGNPPAFESNLYIEHNTSNYDDNDDYYNIHYDLNYFDSDIANDVNSISLKDSDGNSIPIRRQNNDPKRFSDGYNPERNPLGLEIDILMDYNTNPDATLTYLVDEVFEQLPNINFPENGSQLNPDEDLVIQYNFVEGAKGYSCYLLYRVGNSTYWVDGRWKDADENNTFTFDPSVYNQYGDGIYEVRVFAEKRINLTNNDQQEVVSRDTERGIRAIKFVNENGEWESINFINGKPEKEVKIPTESFKNDLVRFVKKTTSRADSINGHQYLNINSQTERMFILGNPPLFDSTLYIQNRTRNLDDNDDYFNITYELKYFTSEIANDVNSVTLKDSEENVVNIRRENYDPKRFSKGYNLERNPLGMAIDILLDYNTNPDATLTYLIDEVFEEHPTINSPENGEQLNAEDDLVVPFNSIQDALGYFAELWYINGNSYYWLDYQSTNADESNMFVFDSSLFNQYGDGVYQVRVTADKRVNLTDTDPQESLSRNSGEIEAVKFVDENGEWESIRFINGKPEREIVIPAESFENDQVRFIQRPTTAEPVKGYQYLNIRSLSERRFIVGDDFEPFTSSSYMYYNINQHPTFQINLSFMTEDFMNSITQAYVEGPVINGSEDLDLRINDLAAYAWISSPPENIVPGDEYTVVIQTDEEIGYTATETVPDYPRYSTSMNWNTNIVDHHINSGQDIEVNWDWLPGMNNVRLDIWQVYDDGGENYVFSQDFSNTNSAVIDTSSLEDGIYCLEIRQNNQDGTVYVLDNFYPFVLGDARDFTFNTHVEILGEEFSDKWHTNFEVQFFGSFQLDDVENVTFNGPCFTEPINYQWTDDNRHRLGAHAHSGEQYFKEDYDIQQGDEFVVTIYAKPETSLARWLELKQTYERGTSRPASETVHATASVTVEYVPEEFDIVIPEDNHIFPDLTDVSVEWEPVTDAEGYHITVQQWNYDKNDYQGDIWSTEVDGNTNTLIIPSQVFKMGHSYRIWVSTFAKKIGPYRYSSADVIWLSMGTPIINASRLDFQYEADGTIGNSEINHQRFLMWVWFYDDAAYQDVKDLMYFESTYSGEELVSGMEMGYNPTDTILWIRKPLDADVDVFEDDWAKVYGVAPDGRTFHTENQLGSKASLPTLTGIDPIRNELEEIIGFKINWNKGIGTCNNQWIDVYKNAIDDDHFVEQFVVGSGAQEFIYEQETPLEIGDTYYFKLGTRGNGESYSILNFEASVQEQLLAFRVLNWNAGPAVENATVEIYDSETNQLLDTATTNQFGEVSIGIGQETQLIDVKVTKYGHARSLIEGLKPVAASEEPFPVILLDSLLNPDPNTQTDPEVTLGYYEPGSFASETISPTPINISAPITGPFEVLVTVNADNLVNSIYEPLIDRIAGAGLVTTDREYVGDSDNAVFTSVPIGFDGEVALYTTVYDKNNNRVLKVEYLEIEGTDPGSVNMYSPMSFADFSSWVFGGQYALENIWSYTRRSGISLYNEPRGIAEIEQTGNVLSSKYVKSTEIRKLVSGNRVAPENGNLWSHLYWTDWSTAKVYYDAYSTELPDPGDKPDGYNLYYSLNGWDYEKFGFVTEDFVAQLAYNIVNYVSQGYSVNQIMNLFPCYKDPSSYLSPGVEMHYQITSVYGTLESDPTYLGSVVPLDSFNIIMENPDPDAVDVPVNPTFRWRPTKELHSSEGPVNYTYGLFIYDWTQSDNGLIVPSTQNGIAQFTVDNADSFSLAFTGSNQNDQGLNWSWYNPYSNEMSPYTNTCLQAYKTYGWGINIAYALVKDTDSRAYSIAADFKYRDTGWYIDPANCMEPDLHADFTTGAQ